MGKIDQVIPVFYVRGYNSPYTEGHIELVRGMAKALLMRNIRSVVFNYRYRLGSQNAEHYPANGEVKGEVKFEQKIPLIDREALFHQNLKSKIVFSSLMETLATPRFFSIERCISRHGRCIANVINSFKYPRILGRGLSKSPVVLHIYARRSITKNTIRMLTNRADLIITSSRSLATHLEKNCGINKQKVQTFYPPIDTESYKPVSRSQSRRRLGLKSSAKLLLYLGNLRKYRFPEETLLNLMKKLVRRDPKIKLLVFSPENRENIRRKMEILPKVSAFNLRQNVRIHIRDLSETEKNTIYSASDIFIFPPLRSGEAVEPPITVLEAMACGLPVVSSDVASIREIITDEFDGLIRSFETGNTSSLSEQIFSLLLNEDYSKSLSDRARVVITEKMSLEKSCGRLVKIFSTLPR